MSNVKSKSEARRGFIFNGRTRFEPVERNRLYGLSHIMPQLENIVEFLKNYDFYAQQGATIGGGVIFCGPKGTGKTYCARWMATACNARFIDMRNFPVELKSGVHMWQPGDIKSLFALSSEWVRKNKRPMVLFVDQFDDFLNVHPQVRTQLEIELDGFAGRHDGVFLIATAQVGADEIEGSLFRPGRIGIHVVFSVPDVKQQLEFLRGFLGEHPHEDGIALKNLVFLLKEKTPAAIKSDIEDAHRLACQEYKLNLADKKLSPEECSGPVIKERHLLRVLLEKAVDAPTGHSLSSDEQRCVRIHELGHYIVARAWGLRAHFICVRSGLRSLGLTSLGDDTKKLLSVEEIKYAIAALFGSMEAEKLLGVPPSMSTSMDLESANEMAELLVSECGYRRLLRKKYGFVSLSRDASIVSQRALSDMERKELKRLLNEGDRRARRTLKFFGKELIEQIAAVFAEKPEGTMLQQELDPLLEPKLSEFHKMYKVEDGIESLADV